MTSYSNNNSKAIVNIGLHHWSGVAIWWVSLSIHVHYSVKSLLAPNESLWVDILLVLLLPGWGKYNTKPEMPKILQSQRMIMSQPEAISRENLLKVWIYTSWDMWLHKHEKNYSTPPPYIHGEMLANTWQYYGLWSQCAAWRWCFSVIVSCCLITCAQEEQTGSVSLCIHQMSSFASDDVTQPSKSLTLQRRSPYAVLSQLSLLFVGLSSQSLYVLSFVVVVMSVTFYWSFQFL